LSDILKKAKKRTARPSVFFFKGVLRHRVAHDHSLNHMNVLLDAAVGATSG
jgi:hypothetical protein